MPNGMCLSRQVINQIKNVVGVRIRVSGRDEYIEGTRDRSVTISGPKEGVAIAEQLVGAVSCHRSEAHHV